MSSQSASSRAVSTNARPASSSLGATMRRLATVIWRSYERHSLYQVMLAAGCHEDLPADFADRPQQVGQC